MVRKPLTTKPPEIPRTTRTAAGPLAKMRLGSLKKGMERREGVGQRWVLGRPVPVTEFSLVRVFS